MSLSNLQQLHLLWEYPPYVSGGLGVASAELCAAIAERTPVRLIHPKHPVVPKYGSSNIRSYQLDIALPASAYSVEIAAEDYIVDSVLEYEEAVKKAHLTAFQSVHAHDWLTAKAACSVQQNAKIPFVLHIHSTQLERVGLHARETVFRQEQEAMQQADHIIAVSHFSKKLIVKEYSIPDEKISVVHHAPPINVHQRRLQDRGKTIAFVGRMESQKSPELAAEIIVRTLRSHPDAKAVMVGSGSKLKIIRDTIKFKKLHHRVEILGEIPHEKMYLIYQTADVLIVPSVAEPFGLVATEAAAHGVAVLLSDKCGVAEILPSAPQLSIQDIHAWTDEINQLFDQPKLIDNQAKQQIAELKNHTWNLAADKTIEIVNKLTESQKIP